MQSRKFVNLKKIDDVLTHVELECKIESIGVQIKGR